MEAFANGVEHLRAELRRLDLMLHRQVLRLRAARLITEDQFRGMYIPDAHVDALLCEAAGPEAERPAGEPGPIQALGAAIERARDQNKARAAITLAAGVELPLLWLAGLFQLSPFELDVLLLGVAPELEQGYQTLYAYIQNDVARKHPSVDLALRLLCPDFAEQLARHSRFDADAPLFRHQLMRLFDEQDDRDPTLLSRCLKADRRVVAYLLGHDQIDGRLRPFTRLVAPARQLEDLALPAPLIARLDQAARWLGRDGGALLLHGPSGAGKQAVAEAVCAELGRPLLVADIARALAAGLPFATTLALLRREAILCGAGLYLGRCEALLADEEPARARLAALADELADPGLPIFMGSEIAWQPGGRWAAARLLGFELPLPDFPLRLRLWRQAAEAGPLAPDANLEALASQFVLSPGQIVAAAQHAALHAVLRPEGQGAIQMADLRAGAQAHSGQALRSLAQRVDPFYGWDDIVLPPRAMQQLRELCASVTYRHVVYGRWGFAQRLALGKGLNALFAGPSGTGKTMAAQIVARELGLELYKIDLANVVSKYIGETEKNLGRIFAAARASNAILFFDEADALFGKRSEVKDAHDRYANIEVAYLLQQMEEYDGVVILATNLRKNMDEAFARRMHHTVEFPAPDAEHRERIWRGVFPPGAPLSEDVNFGFMARQFELSGGNIRNIALAGAFAAAENGGRITMEHLVLATARELQKLGKLPARSDFRDYYELIRERG